MYDSLSNYWYYQSCCKLDLTRTRVQAIGDEIQSDSLKATFLYKVEIACADIS
jgi:hypothetical protein